MFGCLLMYTHDNHKRKGIFLVTIIASFNLSFRSGVFTVPVRNYQSLPTTLAPLMDSPRACGFRSTPTASQSGARLHCADSLRGQISINRSPAQQQECPSRSLHPQGSK